MMQNEREKVIGQSKAGLVGHTSKNTVTVRPGEPRQEAADRYSPTRQPAGGGLIQENIQVEIEEEPESPESIKARAIARAKLGAEWVVRVTRSGVNLDLDTGDGAPARQQTPPKRKVSSTIPAPVSAGEAPRRRVRVRSHVEVPAPVSTAEAGPFRLRKPVSTPQSGLPMPSWLSLYRRETPRRLAPTPHRDWCDVEAPRRRVRNGFGGRVRNLFSP